MLDYSYVNIEKGAFVVCADAGYLHAKRNGIKPDCLIGDFDTLDIEISENCVIKRYSSDKDDTDTMLAIKYALGMGYNDITLFGTMGGRFDHTIANIQALAYIDAQGAKGEIISDNNYVYLQSAISATYTKKEGYYISLLAYDSTCEGITTSGLKYNMFCGKLTNTFPLGVSNEIIGENCMVELNQGRLLVIFSRDNHKKRNKEYNEV
jgi:thiamine pyrophosphokinase